MDPYGMEARARTEPISLPSQELLIFRRAWPPNTMVIGEPNVTAAATTLLLPHLPYPAMRWDASTGADCPSITEGTLMILNLERLDGPGQRQLLDFMNTRRRAVAIVSVATMELFERVERGEFLDALYYRLNTVRWQASDRRDHQSRT